MPKLPGLPDVPRKSFVLMRLLHESPSLISAHFGFHNLAKSEQLEQVIALPDQYQLFSMQNWLQ